MFCLMSKFLFLTRQTLGRYRYEMNCFAECKYWIIHNCSIPVLMHPLENLLFLWQHSLMDCNQNFQDKETQSRYNDKLALEAQCNYALTSADENPESSDCCFDCNICLDSAEDPVVTLCGHLYCWTCIFQWLHVQTSSSDSFHRNQSCPVCKASISHTSLVPLYERSSTAAEQESKRSRLDLYRLHENRTNNNLASDVLNPIADRYQYSDPAQMMIGELFHTRILWSFMGFFADPYPRSYYPPLSSRTPRMRRQEMQADKCLNRVSIFLFCCLILCLVTF